MSENETKRIVSFVRLELYNRALPCGPKAIRERMDQFYRVTPLPSLSTISRVLARRGLTHQRTGWYDGDPCPTAETGRTIQLTH